MLDTALLTYREPSSIKHGDLAPDEAEKKTSLAENVYRHLAAGRVHVRRRRLVLSVMKLLWDGVFGFLVRARAYFGRAASTQFRKSGGSLFGKLTDWP
ncbi:hypothetical protein J2W42_005330 [Rhizobium tibeticum]|uniref:hypothetical protein n=1 Tax=Rhizobium tibeticum TaxID=501024 RepID=UPI00278A6CA8|nr:hypothetical protein [Rhizobium tibeticum]MDP9812460.1 hypothetical protein [Rhizobium tibeticum]